MWYEARKLLLAVQGFQPKSDLDCTEVIKEIEAFKWRLQNICNNPAKSAADRAKLVPDSDITIGGVPLHIERSVVDEAVIISDIFNLNELDALQVVLSGEVQMSHFTGLNRGLLAVYCYYDAQRMHAAALAHILAWNPDELPKPLTDFIKSSFVHLYIFKHLIKQQDSFTVASQFSALTQPNVNGLGGSKHQHMLRNVIEEIGEFISESVYALCGWSGDLCKDFAYELYPVVQQVNVGGPFSSGVLSAWCALVRLTSNELLSQVNCTSAVLSDMITEIRDETKWSDQAVCGTAQLACAVAIRSMSVSPSDHLNITDVKIDVDKIFDRAVQNCAFKFIKLGIIGSDAFKYVPHFRVLDTLLKQVIIHFPSKLYEVERNSEDELNYIDQLKEKGQTSPIHLGHYSFFLGSMAELYYLSSNHRVSVHLRKLAVEKSVAFSCQGSMELCRFLERARNVCHEVHAVAYLDLLRSVCKSSATAAFLFDVFARVPPHQDDYIGWVQIMSYLRQFDRMYRERKQEQGINTRIKQMEPVPLIPPSQLAGIIAFLNLGSAVASMDIDSAENFLEERSWAVIDSVMGLISSPVPLELKGSLFTFLAALAKNPLCSPKIWVSLHSFKICDYADGATFVGLQKELEERECIAKKFDISLGFAKMMKSLLGHGSVPDYGIPFVDYLTRSIISQMSSRSYDDVVQMWELAETSLECLLIILRQSYTDAVAVARKEHHVHILVQLLNDTPVFRTVCTILLEDCDAYRNPSSGSHHPRLSQKTALVALKLLSVATSRHSQIRTAARSANSEILISTLKVLYLSSLRNNGDTLFDMLFHYLDQVEELPCHSYAAANILRDLSTVRPNLQKSMVETIRTKAGRTGEKPIHMTAIAKVLNHRSIQLTVHDIVYSDCDENDATRCRGEVARILLEVLAESVEVEPGVSNLCSALFGFDINDADHLFYKGFIPNAFNEVLAIIEQFDCADAAELPFSALVEPAFRLLHRLVSTNSIFANNILRYIRPNDLIKQLLTAPLRTLLSMGNDASEGDDNTTVYSFSRMVVGYIIHLAATEISSLLKSGHFNKPRELYHLLLDTNEQIASSMNDHAASNLLFSIVHCSQMLALDELAFPYLEQFNAHKLETVFAECKSQTVFGIVQYNVECLHTLLRREVAATQCEDTDSVEQEMTCILRYCTETNNELLQRGAADFLVSGCVSLLNVIALFSPVPFFSLESQIDIMVDSCFVLLPLYSNCSGDSAIAVAECLNRLCKSICALYKQEHPNVEELRSLIERLFTPLVEVIIAPANKPLQAKVSLCDSARFCLRTARVSMDSETSHARDSDNWLCDNEDFATSRDAILSTIDRFSYELGRKLAADISDMPDNLKIAPLLLTSDLLFEDAKGSRKLALAFTKTGMPRYLSELLVGINLDWNKLSHGDNNASQAYNLMRAIIIVLTRLSLTDAGWETLYDLAIPDMIAELPFLVEAPKQVFLEPASLLRKGTCSQVFADSLNMSFHLCLALCAKPMWRKLSNRILNFIRVHSELLGQLMRADIRCSLVEVAARLIKNIHESDDSVRHLIEKDNVLRQLKDKIIGGIPERQNTPWLHETSIMNSPSRLLQSVRIGAN